MKTEENSRPFLLVNEYQLTIEDHETFKLEVLLFKRSNGEYMVTKNGHFGTILTGSDYVLIKSHLAEKLVQLAPYEVNSKPVIIKRKATGEEWKNYSELRFTRSIPIENYFESSSSEIRVYNIGNMIGISQKLKEQLDVILRQKDGVKFTRNPLLAGG